LRFCEGREVLEMIVDGDGLHRSLPIREFCGCQVDRLGKRCAAFEDGRCQP
jgi:hypothetical protein